MSNNKSLFIDNSWVINKVNNFFNYTNYNKIKINIANPNRDGIQNLVNSSKNAFNIWKYKNNKEKSKVLKIISNLLLEKKNFLAHAEKFDTGKPYKQAVSEIEYCYKLWKHASEIVLNVKEKLIKINNKTFCKIYNEPIGVTSVIVPWNFPLLVMSERLPYILAAGCVGIIKPSEYASSSLIKFVDLIKNNQKIPSGIINLITGDSTVGVKLVENKYVRCISFTGSSETGKKVMKKASSNLKRLNLELGGKNPIIIFKDANLKKAIKNVIISFTHNSGQCCVGASRVFVEEIIYERFKFFFKKALEKKKKFFQISNIMQYKKIYEYLAKNRSLSENIFHGELLKRKNKNLKLKPIVFENLSIKNKIHKTELFGPIISIESFNDKFKLKKILDESNYGLACMIWSKNIKKTLNFARGIQIGRLWINGNIKQNYPTIPIGGFKWSGIGRETGDEALESYSETKSIIINK